MANKSKSRKRNAEKAFCSTVAKLVKRLNSLIFESEEGFNFTYHIIKKDAKIAYKWLDKLFLYHNMIDNYLFQVENENVAFLKAGKRIIKIDLFDSDVMDTAEIKKISFVKPTLLFEEVSYKEAKANNTIDFQLVEWISKSK